MSAPGAPGEVISFYSYKGGTGRTMALANVACLLAEQIGERERVLVVDWDLEAPGLHRFFPPRLVPSSALDLGLDAGPGLIDLFIDLDKAIPASAAESDEAADAVVDGALSHVDINRLIADTAVPKVKMIRAGRNDDGQYSSRVGRFNWEDLFRRAPTVYQRVAERLAQTHRYVLIDSRTGVTDISGICTSLLPEKLVVVFTPNRQSLTGVRELIERATAYRKNSDDMRPLIVFPLPSRIEASLEDQRSKWRLGDRDLGIVGYQPMFEDLFKKAYGLAACDLSSYFNDVQIQQTPDYAYGEEIAVRRTSDRFSLGNSYRVFTKRLVSGAPPWPVVQTAPATSESPVSAPAPGPNAPVAVDASTPSAVTAEPQKTPPADRPPRKASVPSVRRFSTPPLVFLSYAGDDREQAERISTGLEKRDIAVWKSGNAIQRGVDFRSAVAEALDASSVVVVLWSKASVRSEWTLAEAEEGLRRGVLIPVLLDEASPPLGFRQLQVLDLRRDPDRGIAELADAIKRTASSAPGQSSSQPESVASSQGTNWKLWLGAAAAVMIVASGIVFTLFRSAGVSAPPNMSPASPDTVRVPNFVNFQTADVKKTADSLGMHYVLTDEQGKPFDSVNGIVTSQDPKPDATITKDHTIRLVVAARAVTVPTLVGAKLENALDTLVGVGLALGSTETRVVADAPDGTIIAQTPSAGTNAPAGSRVNVTVARTRRPSPSVQKALPSPDGRGSEAR